MPAQSWMNMMRASGGLGRKVQGEEKGEVSIILLSAAAAAAQCLL